jgi:beta-lactamase class A
VFPIRRQHHAFSVSVTLALTALLIFATACSGPSSSATKTPPAAPQATATTEAVTTLLAASPTAVASVAPTATTQLAVTPTEPATATTEEDSPSPTISSIDQSAFTAQVDQLASDAGGTVEIVVGLSDGTILYDHDGTDSMESASLYKLGIMVELYRQRDAGLLSFDDTVYMYPGFFSEGEDIYGMGDIGSDVTIGDLLTNMITLSSNVAATALLWRAGTDNINNTLASLGLNSTEIRWTPGLDLPDDTATDSSGGDGSDTGAPADSEQPPSDDSAPTSRTTGIVLVSASGQPKLAPKLHDDARADAALNVTTADDVASLYMQLLRGEVVDADASQEMLDLLAQQQINDRLPVLLPSDTVVAHKTGNLDGLVHDAGVIYAPAGPIIVAVLTEDVDEGVADDMIAQIGLLAYQLAS